MSLLKHIDLRLQYEFFFFFLLTNGALLQLLCNAYVQIYIHSCERGGKSASISIQVVTWKRNWRIRYFLAKLTYECRTVWNLMLSLNLNIVSLYCNRMQCYKSRPFWHNLHYFHSIGSNWRINAFNRGLLDVSAHSPVLSRRWNKKKKFLAENKERHQNLKRTEITLYMKGAASS